MIELVKLCKSFKTAEGTVDALQNVSLNIADGDIYGIIGMSGAGKSTLVRCINMLERPDSGKVLIDGCDMAALSPAELREKRRGISMIFQSFNLLMQRSCLDNICFPMELAGVGRAAARKRARELLETVGLPDKANAYPAQLSGGQQQRIAIARALASDPKVLLCDEATSALDPNTTHSILELIKKINQQLGLTVVVITHQMSVVEEICKQVAILDHGCVVEDGEVAEVFAHPHSEAAQKLVFPDGVDNFPAVPENVRCLRIVFNGAHATGTPIIAGMAMEKNIAANILAASTKSLDDKAYGNMVLSIPEENGQFETALAYLRQFPELSVEEVSRNA